MTTQDSGPMPELPEPTYYSASDYETRPVLLHTLDDVRRHFSYLSKLAGEDIPHAGKHEGLFTAAQMHAYALTYASQQRVAVAELVEALNAMYIVFPTVDEMADAGYDEEEIHNADTVYEAARALLAKHGGQHG